MDLCGVDHHRWGGFSHRRDVGCMPVRGAWDWNTAPPVFGTPKKIRRPPKHGFVFGSLDSTIGLEVQLKRSQQFSVMNLWRLWLCFPVALAELDVLLLQKET